MRGLCGPFADVAAGVCSRRIHALPDHLRGAGADDLEKSGARTSRQVRRTQFRKAVYVESHDRAEQAANPETAQREIKPQVAGTSACSVWRGIVGGVYGRRFHGTGDAAI